MHLNHFVQIQFMFQIYHKIKIISIMIQTAFPNNPHLYLLIVQNQTSVIKKQFNFIAKKFYSSFLLFFDQFMIGLNITSIKTEEPTLIFFKQRGHFLHLCC